MTAHLDDFGRAEWWPLAKLGVTVPHNEAATCAMCEQGEMQWLGIRAGKLTASKIGKVITSKGEPTKSQARKDYAMQLRSERISGRNDATFVSAAMRHGTETEPKARNLYALEEGVDVFECGFILPHDGAQWGYSPDGICPDRLIEIKCPQPKAFCAAVDSECLPPDYALQIQFGMWVTGLGQADFIWYATDGDCRPVYRMYDADAKLHAAFAEHVPAFMAEVDAAEKTTRERIAEIEEKGGRA